jgi:hypothetical protein
MAILDNIGAATFRKQRVDPTRGACLILAIPLLCSLSFSQQSNSTQATVSNPSTASTPATVSGCLMNLNGTFYLTTANGERFILKGKHNAMFNHNGQQVEITVKPEKDSAPPAGPKKLTVTHIEMLAQVCQ